MKIDRSGASKGARAELGATDHALVLWDGDAGRVRLSIHDMPDLYSKTARYSFDVYLTPQEIANALGELSQSGLATYSVEIHAAFKPYVSQLARLLACATEERPPSPKRKRKSGHA